MDVKNKKTVWRKFAVMTMVIIGIFVIFLRRRHYGSMELEQ